MATIPSQPEEAVIHYDLAVQKRMNSEDLYFFRSEALYELKPRCSFSRLRKMSEFRKDHQKYLLLKAAIQYEKGDLNMPMRHTMPSRNCTTNKLLFTCSL